MKKACVILNYNDADQTIQLVNEIKDYPSLDIILIVDNHSTDDSWERFCAISHGKVHAVRTDHNGGYGAGNNFGIRVALTQFECQNVLIVNPDVHFSNDLVEDLYSALLSSERNAVAGAIQLDSSSSEITMSAWKIPNPWRYIFSTSRLTKKWGENYYYPLDYLHASDVVAVDCVAGSLLLVDATKFLEVGGYDENVFLYCEETVLGCKFKERGYTSVICSNVTYQHHHGISIRKSIDSAVKRRKMLLKSHEYVIKNYLNANMIQLIIDKLFRKYVVLEEYVKQIIRK